MNPIRLSWKLAWRDWRAGELGLLLVAVVVAVASIASVGFFVDRMRGALVLQARELMGADLVLASDQPPAAAFIERARSLGLSTARTVTFPSMVLAGGKPHLVSVKAVSQGYPLRGEVRVSDGGGDRAAGGIPPPGAMWADGEIVTGVPGGIGASVELGDARFRVERRIDYEPDRGASFANFAPRVMINLDDIPATGLVQPASRVRWHLLVAGGAPAVESFRQWVAARLGPGMRIQTLENGRPELRTTLDRAERFLDLVALLSALIAAVAIGLAARRFAERHADGCAVMRAIGVKRSLLLGALAFELLWIALAGGVVGVAIGWAVHLALVGVIAPVIGLALPPAGFAAAWKSIAAGTVLLLGFGGSPFLRLASVAPLRVLRREAVAAGAGAWIGRAAALAAFLALLLWMAGDRSLALIALGGFAGGTVVFAAVVWLALRAIAGVRHAGEAFAGLPSLRLALASLSRRGGATVAQVVALAIGLMALMLLGVTRTDLLDSWNHTVPADAPNRFVINIQPDQREEVSRLLGAAGAGAVQLDPMVRGRLVAVNGRPVHARDYHEEQARHLVDREFNLSYASQAPGYNRIVAGHWMAPDSMEASAEQGIMHTLGLALGDELSFLIAGETVKVRLTSVRKLSWDSMKVNFFMILSPRALRDAPATWITAYHQRADQDPVERELVRRMPNLTVFDTGNLIRQVRALLDQVALAVQILFVLTLAAGVTVLFAAQSASRDQRTREAALMRALGASRARLVRSQVWELGLGGGLAGLLAAAGSTAIGWVLAVRVFGFDFEPRWASLPLGAAAGAVLAIAAGWWGLRAVLDSPPLASLRAA